MEPYIPKIGSAERKHRRVAVDISIHVFPNSAVPTLGRTQDICRGGMAFYAPLDLVHGNVIRVTFELPYSRVRFGVAAVVIDRNGFRYGVEFLELASEEATEIDRIVGILALTQD